MTTVRARQLLELVRQSRPASDPEVKHALTAVSVEVKERLAIGSRESHDFFVSVVDSIQDLKGTAQAQLRAQCLLECCQYFYVSGSPTLALLPARNAIRLATNAGGKSELRRAFNMLGILCADTGNLGEALECYAEAVRLAREIGDEEAEVATWVNLGTALAYMSRYQDSLACLEQVRIRAPNTRIGSTLVRKAAHNMSLCYFNLGDLDRAKQSSAFALSGYIPTTAEEFYSHVIRSHHYVEALLESGDFPAAKACLTTSKDFARLANTERALECVRITTGLVEVYCGDATRGLAELESVASSARESPMIWQDAINALTRAYERTGQTEKALACLQETLRIGRTRREAAALTHVAVACGVQMPHDYRSRMDLAELQQRVSLLQAKVAEREMLRSQIEVLERLAVTADLREEESGAHGYRVGRLSALFAESIGWARSDTEMLEQAARLHDIGKIGIPDRILLSTESLQESERKLMSAHTSIGAELLARSSIDQLRLAEEIALCHHEWWDGTGYPTGIAGNRIPVAARIVALADVFDSLTHGRTFQKPWTQAMALAEIQRLSGRQFEAGMTARFLTFLRALIACHNDLDAYLGCEAIGSTVLRARSRIRSMLDGAEVPNRNARFDLATSKS